MEMKFRRAEEMPKIHREGQLFLTTDKRIKIDYKNCSWKPYAPKNKQ